MFKDSLSRVGSKLMKIMKSWKNKLNARLILFQSNTIKFQKASDNSNRNQRRVSILERPSCSERSL